MANNLGNWIRAGLADIGKNQTWLADQIGVEPPQISRIISGSSEAKPDILNKIADALRKPREQAYKAAGHLSRTSVSDEWIDEQVHKLSQIPHEMRPLAGRVIAGFVEEEPRAVREPKTKPAAS